MAAWRQNNQKFFASFFQKRRTFSLPASQGLFIIGAARSGTTILQNALNDSPDIFLFGEPNFHKDPGTPDFASRFNAMHRRWANQETKSSSCPPILNGDGTWQDHFVHLARFHRYVGAKIVINPVRTDNLLELLYGFHASHFYPSHYIFTFRDPVATILSTFDLQALLIGRTDDMKAIMRGYVDTVSLFVRMYRTLPNVRAVCHDDISQSTFEALGDWLGIRLPRSHLYYDARRVLPYTAERFPAENRQSLAHIIDLYEKLRRGLGAGFDTPQLDQNNNHLNPAHLTPLGLVARQAELIAADLPLVTSQPLGGTVP